MDNLHSDEMHDLYFSPKIFGRSNQEGCGDLVTGGEEKRNKCRRDCGGDT